MATSSVDLHKSYDTIVIGAGLSGLLVAQQLQVSGQKVLLIERNEALGGLCRVQSLTEQTVSFGLKILPATSSARRALDFVGQAIGQTIHSAEVELPPVSFEAGFKPFVGFGANAPECVEVVNYYTSAQRLQPETPPHQWVQRLAEQFKGEHWLDTFVTRILVDSENRKITGVVINGSKAVSAHNLVFCAHPAELKGLLDSQAVSGKFWRELARASEWTALSLDWRHRREVCAQSNVHVLFGTGENSLPCLGLFHPLDESGQQLSQWLVFVQTTDLEDPDLVATALKQIKRQARRAWPEIADTIVSERLVVSPNSHGRCALSLTGQQTVPGLSNLWLAHPSVNAQPNLIGAIAQAQLTLAAMGFGQIDQTYAADTTDANL